MNREAPIVPSIALDMLSLVSFTVVELVLRLKNFMHKYILNGSNHDIIFAVKPDKISAQCYPPFSLHAWVTIQDIFIIPYCASFQVSVGLCRLRNKSQQEALAWEWKAYLIALE
jgi:hypothetical protein